MAKKKIEIPFSTDEYSYRVFYSPEEESFVALIDELPGLSALASTMEGALREIRVVVKEGLRLLLEKGQPIPEPLIRREYSGKFVVRIAPSLHRQIATEAMRKGVSLNEYVNEKLSLKPR
jgi:predicted HicB family RNase H-like nuclease